MKASLIISSEYKMNQPSVFIFVDGKYYGCQSYPAARNYPKSVDYWLSATSSDDDRFFAVSEVEYTQEQFDQIVRLQSSVEANTCLLRDYPKWQPHPSFNVKRGRAYQQYLSVVAAEAAAIKVVSDYNAPYSTAIRCASDELRHLILSAKK